MGSHLLCLASPWAGISGVQRLRAWLVSPLQKEGEFTLHSRAILEMEQYIRETFSDSVKTCNICRGLLIQVCKGARWSGS